MLVSLRIYSLKEWRASGDSTGGEEQCNRDVFLQRESTTNYSFVILSLGLLDAFIHFHGFSLAGTITGLQEVQVWRLGFTCLGKY